MKVSLCRSDLHALRVGILYENRVLRQPGPALLQLPCCKSLKKYGFFSTGTQLAYTHCPSLAQRAEETPQGEGRASQPTAGMSARGSNRQDKDQTRRNVQQEFWLQNAHKK